MFGLSTIRLVFYGVVVAAVLGAGLYAKHIYAKSQRVPVLEKALADYAALIARERVQAQQRIQNEIALQKKLSAATAGNAELLRGLRTAYRKTMPPLTTASAFSPGASGTGSGPSESDNLDRAVTEAISACKRDSVKLMGWQEWWSAVPDEFKQ